MLLVALLPSLAHAHAVGLSQGTYTATRDGLEAQLTFTKSEVQTSPSLAEHITAPGCSLTESRWAPAERDGLTLTALWSCRAAPKSIALAFFELLPPGHRHLVGQQVFHAKATTLALQAPAPGFGAIVLLGVEHILTGFDHLLFLFGMVLVAARARAVLKVVTAFTVAHSLTLALGVLGVFAPSPRWVEPLIALSIAYVGLENLLVKDLEKRWRIAFGFGLLHGFGFAGGLQEIGASSQLPLTLLGFNLGVEAGQLAVLAVLLPLLSLVRSSQRRWLIAKPALSALVVVPGLVWFVARVVDAS